MIDYKKAGMFGVVYGVFTYILAWLVGLILNTGSASGQTTLNLAAIGSGVKSQIQSGVNTDLASKVIGWISGVSPFELMGLITVGIAGFLIAILGAFVLNSVKAFEPLTKTPLRRVIWIAVFGTLISGGILSLIQGNPSLPAFGSTISMVLYFTISAILYLGLAKLVEKTQARNLFVQP